MVLKIINDPIPFVLKAFEELFPEILADIQYIDGLEGAGRTTFPDDGSTPLIDISTDIPLSALPEILAHELAHTARPNDEHGVEWEGAFNLLFDRAIELYEYNFTINKEN